VLGFELEGALLLAEVMGGELAEGAGEGDEVALLP
jgi:hypothetical protein